MPLLDKRFIFYRNEIGDQDRELDPVPLLCFGYMLHIARNAPRRAERNDDVPRLNQSIETAPPERQIDEIVNSGLHYPIKESRIAGEHAQHVGEFAQEPRRLRNCFPWRVSARRVQICRDDLIEIDGHQLLVVNAEPAESDATVRTVDPLGLNKDLKCHALQAGRVSKMIEVSDKVLDLEPNHRLAVVPDADTLNN